MVLVWLLMLGFAGAKEKVHPQVLRFSGIVQIDEAQRVSVLGTFGPGEFFESLHAVDSDHGRTFLNDGGQVRFFPDRMKITLRMLGPVATDGRSIPSKKLDHYLMRGLQFKVKWKRGMKLRDVREFRLFTPSESSFMDLENSGLPIDGWTYEMVVADAQVPITDHLILYIFSPENKLIARMSAYL